MDYFYAANGFGSQGLMNYFFKAKYNAKDKLTLFAELHGFNQQTHCLTELEEQETSYLGTELDLKMSYNFTKLINIEAGYSYMQATNTMASAQVKNVTNANLTPQWAYVSLKFHLTFWQQKNVITIIKTIKR